MSWWLLLNELLQAVKYLLADAGLHHFRASHKGAWGHFKGLLSIDFGRQAELMNRCIGRAIDEPYPLWGKLHSGGSG